MGERRQHQHRHGDDRPSRCADIADPAQRVFGSEVDRFGDLIERSDHQQSHRQRRDLASEGVDRGHEPGRHHGSESGDGDTETAHHPHHPPADEVAALTGRRIGLGSVGTRDQEGGGLGQPGADQIADDNQLHGDLGRGTVDRGEPRLHELKHGERREVTGVRETDRHPQAQQRRQGRPPQTPGTVRAEGLAMRGAQEVRDADRDAEELREVRRPCGAGDAQAPTKDEQLVEDRIDENHQDSGDQGEAGLADAVEERGQRAEGDRRRRAEHSRLPEVHGEASDGRRQAQPGNEVLSRPRHDGEDRSQDHCDPKAGPCRVRGTRATARPERLSHHDLRRVGAAPRQHDEHKRHSLHCRERRKRLARETADEPGIRQVEDDLDGTDSDQRCGHAEHRSRRHPNRDRCAHRSGAGVSPAGRRPSRLRWPGGG